MAKQLSKIPPKDDEKGVSVEVGPHGVPVKDALKVYQAVIYSILGINLSVLVVLGIAIVAQNSNAEKLISFASTLAIGTITSLAGFVAGRSSSR